MTLGISARFADETEIHGIAHMARAKSVCEKKVWMIVVTAALISTICGVSRTILEYVEQPLVTSIFFEPLQRFPSFSICPPFWVNETKARRFGMDESDYRIFGNLLNAIFGYGYMNESMENQENFKQKFGGVEVDKIIRDVSFDAGGITKAAYGRFGGINVSAFFAISLELTTAQPCVIVKSNLQFQPIGSERVELLLIGPEWPNAFNVSLPIPVFKMIYVGDDAISVSPRFPTRLAAKYLYHINIKAVKTKLHPSRPGGCRKHVTQLMNIQCETNSRLQFCKDWGGGTLYVPERNITVADLMEARCNFSAVNERGMHLHQVVRERCQTPCEEWNYEVTVTNLGEVEDGGYGLLIEVAKPEHSTAIEEFLTMSGESFMSNLGGQIALYTGASFVSLVHIIMFVVAAKRGQPQNS